MANSVQARKRARQAEETRQRNASLKSALRTAVKKVKKAIATGDKAAAATQFQASQAVIACALSVYSASARSAAIPNGSPACRVSSVITRPEALAFSVRTSPLRTVQKRSAGSLSWYR